MLEPERTGFCDDYAISGPMETARMNMSCPVTPKSYRGGQVGAFFADVAQAITAGTNEAEALDRAQDALLVALSSHLHDGRPLPRPSKAKHGQPVVVLPPRAAIKLAIHEAMCEPGVTQAQLGEMLGIDRRQVRRILNLDHESRCPIAFMLTADVHERMRSGA